MTLTQDELQTLRRLTESDSPVDRDVIDGVDALGRLQDEIAAVGAGGERPPAEVETGENHPERWLRGLSTVLDEVAAPGDGSMEVST